MNEELLILVDDNDQEWGKMEKLKVHELGLLHRAFSVFLFNTQGQLLLQRRALTKYHSGGLWTNTCCSHPRYGESFEEAVPRRLMEEMGMTCSVDFQFKFTYKASFNNGLIEHECDHVFFGITDDLPGPNPSEVDDFKYVDMGWLEKDIDENPQNYTEWLKICLEQVKTHLKSSKAA